MLIAPPQNMYHLSIIPKQPANFLDYGLKLCRRRRGDGSRNDGASIADRLTMLYRLDRSGRAYGLDRLTCWPWLHWWDNGASCWRIG